MPGARLLFSLDPAISYLNHGSFGAVPIGVQRTQQRLRDEADANPMRFHRGLTDRIAHIRRYLAAFLGADPDGAALVPNATNGVSVVLNSLGIGAGDEVLLTDHGYGAVRLAVEDLCRRVGATVHIVPIPLNATDDEIVRAVSNAVRPGRTRLAVVDQVASATARLFPVRAIAEALRTVDVPVLVDAAHAPGMLDVRVDSLAVDFWVGNFHKWAFAPRATALLCVAPQWRDRIRPLVVSWYQDSGFPLSVERQGTLDHSPWLAAPTGIYTLRSLGIDQVRAHNSALVAYGQRVVGAAFGHEPADLPDPSGPGPGPGPGPEVSMRVIPLPPGTAGTTDEAMQLIEYISDHLGTEVAINAWRGLGLLRLSAQVYNRAEEYDRLAERLPALLAKRQ